VDDHGDSAALIMAAIAAPDAASQQATRSVAPPRAAHSIRPVAIIAVVVVGAALRIWQATTHGLTFDESFTAMAARLPAGSLFDQLRVADSHSPLDYLLRAPFAVAGLSDFWIRVPSLLFSIGALVLFARWMAARGTSGFVAVALFAASPFLILHGGEARMYALLQLLGVAAAMLAEARLRAEAWWQCWAAGALVVIACFDHVSGILLAAGLFAAVGLGRTRAHWAWRAAVVAGVAIWALSWGPVFVQQAGNDWSGWIPPTGLAAFVQAMGGQVTNVTGARLLVVLAVAGGGYLLWRRDGPLGQVWLACGVLPFVLAAAIGIVSPFLIDRTLTVAAWAAPVALGAFAEATIRRGGRVMAAAVAAALVLGGLAAVSAVAGTDLDSDRAITHLESVARPGDVIATLPARGATLAGYRIGVEHWQRTRTVALPGISGASAFRETAVPATRRIWLFSPGAFAGTYPGYEACPGTERWRRGSMTIDCIVRSR
jgi:hypothetical protein